MNRKNEENETISGNSSETKTNSKESELKYSYKKYSKKYKKKKVKFKSNFVKIIEIESYKKYNGDNETNNKQNFHAPKYKEIVCTCSIF